jgi:hypothetical protein
VPLPDLRRKLAPATPRDPKRQEILNALGRLQADRPKLADACMPANMGKLVSLVLDAIDQECRWRFGLWQLEEREKYLRVWSVLRAEGIDVGMRSLIGGGGGYQREPIPWIERTRRKEQLLRIPAVMELAERVVVHAKVILAERELELAELQPNGRRIKGLGYASIDFFMGPVGLPDY